MTDVSQALRIANLAIEELAEENAALYERLAECQRRQTIDREMVSVALEALWQQNAMAEAVGELRSHLRRRR